LPIGVLIRLIPNAPCAYVFEKVEKFFDLCGHALAAVVFPVLTALHLKKKKEKKTVLPVSDPEKVYGIPLVLDNLKVLSTVRGGRVRSSSIVGRSRTKVLEVSLSYFQCDRC
jgi:hypothetical protein